MQNVLAGLTFLIVGDSHFVTKNYLISTLQDGLLSKGAQVETFGACGVPAGAWVAPRPVACGIANRSGKGPVVENRTPKVKSWSIDALIDQTKPSVVVVGIGDPMAGYNQREMQKGWIRENVDELIGRIKAHNLPCVWIGPGWGSEGGPYSKTFARVKEFSDFMATSVAPCTYIDSLARSKPGEWPTFDGQHYTVAGYQKWGAALTDAMLANQTVKALPRK